MQRSRNGCLKGGGRGRARGARLLPHLTSPTLASPPPRGGAARALSSQMDPHGAAAAAAGGGGPALPSPSAAYVPGRLALKKR